MRNILMELFQEMDINPEITCPYPKGNAGNCKVCKYSKSEYLCDITARKVDYLIQNGIIAPPCKIGDTVYIKFMNDIIERRCVGFRCSEDMQFEYIIVELISDRIGNVKRQPIHISQLGKTIFLTKKEAEKALRGEGE